MRQCNQWNIASKASTNKDNIELRSSVGTWFSSWLNVGIFVLTCYILQINMRSLEYSKKNVNNTQKVAYELESINNKLSNLG